MKALLQWVIDTVPDRMFDTMDEAHQCEVIEAARSEVTARRKELSDDEAQLVHDYLESYSEALFNRSALELDVVNSFDTPEPARLVHDGAGLR